MRFVIALSLSFLLFVAPVRAQTLPAIAGQPPAEIFDPAQWRSPQRTSGLTTYMRPSRVPQAVESLLVMRLAAAPERVLETLTDVERFCEWVANCMAAQPLDRRGPANFSYALRIAFPPPYSDRFSVVSASVHRVSERDVILIGGPDARHATYVMSGSRPMQRAEGAWRIRRIDANTTEVSAYFAINPGGGVPLWATAAFSRQNAVATARALRARLQRS